MWSAAQWYQLYHVGFCISHKSNEIAESTECLGMLRSCFSIECKLEKLVSLEIQSKNCKLFGVNHHFQNPRSAPAISRPSAVVEFKVHLNHENF